MIRLKKMMALLFSQLSLHILLVVHGKIKQSSPSTISLDMKQKKLQNQVKIPQRWYFKRQLSQRIDDALQKPVLASVFILIPETLVQTDVTQLKFGQNLECFYHYDSIPMWHECASRLEHQTKVLSL